MIDIEWARLTKCAECHHVVNAHARGIGCLACACAAVNWLETGAVMAWQELNREASSAN